MEKLTGRSVRNLSLGDVQIAKDYAMDQMGVNELPPINRTRQIVELLYLPTKIQKIIQSVIPFRKVLLFTRYKNSGCNNSSGICKTDVCSCGIVEKKLEFGDWFQKYANAYDAETIKHMFFLLNISEKYIIEAVFYRFVIRGNRRRKVRKPALYRSCYCPSGFYSDT